MQLALADTREILRRMALSSSTSSMRARAAATLVWRLARCNCALPPQTRFKDKRPVGDAVALLRRDASQVERLIIRAVSMTSGAAQFGVSPNGEVFTTDCDGYSFFNGRRRCVTGLSPVLDEAAEIFNEWQRNGAGGRFYERSGRFFDGDTKRTFLALDEV